MLVHIGGQNTPSKYIIEIKAEQPLISARHDHRRGRNICALRQISRRMGRRASPILDWAVDGL